MRGVLFGENSCSDVLHTYPQSVIEGGKRESVCVHLDWWCLTFFSYQLGNVAVGLPTARNLDLCGKDQLSCSFANGHEHKMIVLGVKHAWRSGRVRENWHGV